MMGCALLLARSPLPIEPATHALLLPPPPLLLVQPTPPWDSHGYYRASLCDVLYGSEMTKPVPIDEAWNWVEPAAGGDHEGAAASGSAGAVSSTPAAGPRHWVRVPPAAPLLSPLIASDYVVPDIPVLHGACGRPAPAGGRVPPPLPPAVCAAFICSKLFSLPRSRPPPKHVLCRAQAARRRWPFRRAPCA